MKYKQIHSQLSNLRTFEMKKREMLTLAENVFNFKNLPKFISKAYVNKCLVRKGSIAFFIDEVMGLLALPYTVLGKLDVYGRPQKIKVASQNGYIKTIDNPDDFVIMYDNNGLYPIYLDILQYAERMALDIRTGDINIAQQKTPRFWKTSSEKEKTIRDLINNVDSFENTVIAYEDIDFDDTSLVIAPAPYVADKIDEHKEKIWNEFLRLIGVANMNFQKKERNIKDEVLASQGGTIASRFSRFEPRKDAVEEINEKFGNRFLLNGEPVLKDNIVVEYYDGLPSMNEDINDIYNYEEEEEENDLQ